MAYGMQGHVRMGFQESYGTSLTDSLDAQAVPLGVAPMAVQGRKPPVHHRMAQGVTGCVECHQAVYPGRLNAPHAPSGSWCRTIQSRQACRARSRPGWNPACWK